jgi:hypothetical protein
MPFSQIIP